MYTNLLPAPSSVPPIKINRKKIDLFRASKASALMISAVCKKYN